MARDKFRSLRYLLLLCVFVLSLVVSIGSIDDDDDDDLSDIQGIWKLKTITSYDSDSGECETSDVDDMIGFSMFVKVSEDTVRTYYSYGGSAVTYCSDDDEDVEGDDGSYSVSGDTLTVYPGDDESSDCKEKGIFEKASSSDIEGAVESCTDF